MERVPESVKKSRGQPLEVMWNEMDTDPSSKGKRGESQVFGADVVLSDEAVMFENQQLTVPTPDFLTLSHSLAE
jgi:hypothetical protein